MKGFSDYQHPGELFIAQYGRVTDRLGVTRYVDFLRREAGLNDEPPIDLALIFRHFAFPTPKRVSLPGQSGVLMDPDRGIIFISSDDSAVRQRFSEAHELLELLFPAHSSSPSWSNRTRNLFSDKVKERLCEEGAAELLMPLSTFIPHTHQWGVSLEAGQKLAVLYDISLTAALLRAVRFGPGKHALVLWKLAWKPTEKDTLLNPDQLPLFEDYTPYPPSQKLRVRWGCSTQGGPFIPPNKSIKFDTHIYQAYEQGSVTNGMDWLDLSTFHGHCFCESMAITLDSEPHVLSVIHLPEDEHSIFDR
ncbi:MAG: ImmA/IrrE family metallo-endopeptidase [Chloroflexi bacterium]|nr:ImmA/IrrE family metallo-endopeptidase [Pseudomonadota bacterium]MBU1662755.1 ImmA/IrrE family metallo-endopeptidase [Chloroflexota bacterium]